MMPERRHSFAKKNTVSMAPMAMFHHNQLPAMPLRATSSVTANGVSAAKVVATMAVPAMYQGMFLPERKNWPVSAPARFEYQAAMARIVMKKARITSQSK